MNLFSKEKFNPSYCQFNSCFMVCYCSICYVWQFHWLSCKRTNLTYDKYKIDGCGKYIYEDEYDDKDYCFIQYEEYKVSTKNNRYYTKRNFINSIGNIVIVGSFIFLK